MDKYLLCWSSIGPVGSCEILADDCDDAPDDCDDAPDDCDDATDDTNDEAVIAVGHAAVNHTRCPSYRVMSRALLNIFIGLNMKIKYFSLCHPPLSGCQVKTLLMT